MKYNNAILSSPLNEKANDIINEAKVLYTKATQKILFNMVIVISGKNSTKHTAEIKRHKVETLANPNF